MPQATVRFGGYQGEGSILTRALRRLAASLEAVPGAGWQAEVVRDVTEQGAQAVDLLAMVEQGRVEILLFRLGLSRGARAGARQLRCALPALDRARLYAELDGGALGTRLAGDLAQLTGYKLLAYWDNGVRHITNRLRPIRHPDDCRGLRIRTLDNATYQRVFADIGFTPLVIDVKDLAKAVASHAVDAQENPLTNTVNFGLHGTHKHLSLTAHFHGVALLLANRAWFEALAPAVQAGVLAASADATAAQRQWAIDEDALCLERLKAEGVAIVPAEEIDFAAFRAAVG